MNPIVSRRFLSLENKALAARIDEELGRLELALAEHLTFASPVADAPARYLLEAGGKRIRPILTYLAAEFGAGVNDDVRKAAMVVELTHLASLYHDDVMDNAALRRGVDAAHVVWSNSVAILAGDLLFARASTLATGMGDEAIRLQAETFERLCLGQLHETLGPAATDDPVAFYLGVLADKTGSLISTAARLGAMYAGASAEAIEAVTSYGEKIGVAFQLTDDVIDLAPASDGTGKVAGTDLRAGVVTMPMLLLTQSAKTNADDAQLLAALTAHDRTTAAFDDAITKLREHRVTAETKQLSRQWADDAVSALTAVPSSPATAALKRLAQAVSDRKN